MADKLEYIYILKDMYSKKLESITKKQITFTNAYAKSMGKVIATAKVYQESVKQNTRHLNNNKQAMARSIKELDMLKRANQDYSSQANRNLNNLISKQASYNSLLSRSVGQMNRQHTGFGLMPRGSSVGAPASRGMGAGLRGVQSQVDTVLGGVFSIKNAIYGLGTAWVGSKVLMMPINAASFLEDQLISYEVKLGGSSAKAKILVDDLQKLGALTPFNFEHLARATDMLIGVGDVTEKNIINRLQVLGDISEGDPNKLNNIAYAYKQILSAGRLKGNDVLQLTSAGVQVKHLARGLGLTVEQFEKLQGRGKITSQMVTKAFQWMNSSSGPYYQMMIKKSKTFSGLMSTLGDNITMTAVAIGNTMLPEAKKLAIRFTEITQKVKEWVELNKDDIAKKVKEGFAKLRTVIEYVYDNFDRLWGITKRVASVLWFLYKVNMSLKFAFWVTNTVTLLYTGTVWGLRSAVIAYNFVSALMNLAVYKNIFALRRSRHAFLLVKGAVWAVRTAKLALIFVKTLFLLATTRNIFVLRKSAWAFNLAKKAIIAYTLWTKRAKTATGGLNTVIGKSGKIIPKALTAIGSAASSGGLMALVSTLGVAALLTAAVATGLGFIAHKLNILEPMKAGIGLGDGKVSVAGRRQMGDINSMMMAQALGKFPTGVDLNRKNEAFLGPTTSATGVTQQAVGARQDSMTSMIKSLITGNIKVEAMPGTKVLSKMFDFDTGLNMGGI